MNPTLRPTPPKRFVATASHLLLACTLALALSARAADWSAAGSLGTSRSGYAATRLASGKVFVAGGSGVVGRLWNVEVYDPATDAWSDAANLATPRQFLTATLLPSGKVLAVGGYDDVLGILGSAELYDPATDAWSAAGSLATARYYHSATLLPSGKVLVIGGAGGSGALASAELYDPATNAWSAAGSLAEGHYAPTATLLPNGKVLVAAGAANGGIPLGSAELYNPATNMWSAAGSLAAARYLHTAALLPSGKVLVVGGLGGAAGTTFLGSAELYNPATNAWSATGSLAVGREEHTATSLPNGKVLVTGGNGGSGNLASAELYDPGTNAWSAAGSLATARLSHTATLLLSGKVLAAAGYNDGGYLASAELYAPPEIAVEQPAGSNLTDGSASIGFGTATLGSSSAVFTFTMRNSGTGDLAVGTISTDGADAGDFIVDATGMLATVPPGGSTTFSVTFTPAAAGTRNAALHIANDDSNENPFDIALTGTALSFTQDTDGDGMNDAAEYLLAALGFDWQVAQPALVNTYYANANGAGLFTQAQYDANRVAGRNDVINAPNTYSLYTLAQVQALNVGVPLLTKDAATGKFKLTIAVQKTTVLGQPFTPFPFTAPDTTINGQGKVEFLFTVPDNAAFFRLEAH